MRAGGEAAYAGNEIPGCNRELPPEGVPPLPPGPVCGSPSNAWVRTDSGIMRQGTIVGLIGVVRASSRIIFELRDADANVVATHTTDFSRANCVVHHEPEWFDTRRLPPGFVHVTAANGRWEDNALMCHEVAVLEILPEFDPPPPEQPPPPEEPPADPPPEVPSP